MVIVHSPISCASAWLDYDPRETLRSCPRGHGEERGILSDGESASPNPERGKLDSASLHQCWRPTSRRWRSLPLTGKSMNSCTCQASRGDWRERALKEYPRYPGDPSRSRKLVVSVGKGSWGSHNPGSLRRRKSDRPIVARKRGNARGAKRPDRYRVFKSIRSAA